MDISISYYTAQGSRPNNEDSVSLLECNRSTLAVVADGLGGHSNGEVASRQAVSSLNRMLQGKQPDEDELFEAIQQASRDIYAMQNPAMPMRTTVSALWVGEYGAVAGHVGDSRIYQFRDGRIVYQSMDHSVAQMAVLVGELQPDEIRTSKDRNKLIRVLGDAQPPKPDIRVLSTQPGDRFLLCSDGFWEAVTEADMLQAMANSTTAQQWLSLMQQKVEDAAKVNQDNHTAVAILVNQAV